MWVCKLNFSQSIVGSSTLYKSSFWVLVPKNRLPICSYIKGKCVFLGPVIHIILDIRHPQIVFRCFSVLLLITILIHYIIMKQSRSFEGQLSRAFLRILTAQLKSQREKKTVKKSGSLTLVGSHILSLEPVPEVMAFFYVIMTTRLK